MHLDVTPESLAGASGLVAALTARLIGANAAHTATLGLIEPPGADIPSVKTAASLVAKGLSHEAMAAMGNTELASSSMGVGESSVSYAIGEAEGVAIYTAASGGPV